MKVFKSIAVVVCFLPVLLWAAVACGTDEEPKGEEQLRQTAFQAQRAFLAGTAEEAYAFFSSDYQARCPLEEFRQGLLMVQALYGGSKNSDITIGEVRFEGDKAFVSVEVGGQDISADAQGGPYPYYWRLEDGHWKRNSDDPAPCKFSIATPAEGGG